MSSSQEDRLRWLDQSPVIIKFLQLMGISGKKCAKMFEIDQPTWSRMRNGYYNNDEALCKLQELYNEWCVDKILALQDRIEYLKSLVK